MQNACVSRAKKFYGDTMMFVSIMWKFRNNVVDKRRSNIYSSHALLHVHDFLSKIYRILVNIFA